MSSRKRRILVVDDVPQNIRVVNEILKDKFAVQAATDGERAVEIALSDNPPDLILLDIMMPEMDGFEVCARIRDAESSVGVPIIFLTAKQDRDSVIQGLELGGQDYITKPFDPDELVSRVATQIQLREKMETRERAQRAKSGVAHDLMKEFLQKRKAEGAILESPRIEAMRYYVRRNLKIINTAGETAAGRNAELSKAFGAMQMFLKEANGLYAFCLENPDEKVQNYLRNLTYLRQKEDAPATLGEFIRAARSLDEACATMLRGVSRMEKLAPEPTGIGSEVFELGEEIRSRLQLLVVSEDIGIESKLGDAIFLKGPKAGFSQILLQVITNAEEAVRAVDDHVDKPILITAYTKGATAYLEITDWGEGIPVQNAPKLLAAFFTTRTDHLGLGLYVVNDLMKNDFAGSVSIGSGGDYSCRVRLGFPLE